MRRRLLALIVAPLWLLLAAPLTAQTFPPLTGRVVDAANILPPDVEAAIVARSAALEATTGAQAVVATVPDLQGYPIEDYGYRLLRHWGIGRKGVNDGVILIVAPNERKVRIEVGYGLEPVMTDGLSSSIIRQTILPKFRSGDMAGGVADGYAAIAAQLELPPEEAAARARQAPADDADFPIGAIIFLLFFLFWIWLAFRSSRKGRRAMAGGKTGSATGPIIIWGPGTGSGSGGGWGSGSGGWGSGGGGFSGGGGWGGGGGASGGW